MVSYIVKGSKYITGYIDDGDDDYRIKPLHIMLLKTRGYVNWCFLLIENDDFSEKYNDTWNKVSNSIKTEFDR